MLDQQSRILGTVGSEDGNDSRNLGRMGRLRTLRNATTVWWPISAFLESASYTFYNGYINRSSNPCRGATSVGYQPAPLFSLTASLPAVRVIPNTSQVFGTVVFSSLKTRLPGSIQHRPPGFALDQMFFRPILRFLLLTGRHC